MRGLIVTLTANPAIDLNFTVDQLAFNDRAYLQEKSEAAGGRGINASLVLESFGVPTMAIAPCGGCAADRFEGILRSYGFPYELVPIRSEIRTNRSITDRQGLTVKLDELGPTLDPDEVERLERAVHAQLSEATWLLLCGSLPPGVPRDFYSRLVAKAGDQGVHTLLDTDLGPLEDGLEARPTLVAPNQREAERLLNRALITRAHFHEAARRIREMGAESVILSLGGRGAVVAHARAISEVLPPRVDAVCPIGAGDALNAVFLWAMRRSDDFFDAVRWGVAAGTASASLPGLNFANMEQTRTVYDAVEVRPVA